MGALALLAASSPSVAHADTVVIQESKGFFGSNDSDDTARQKISLGEKKLKVLDEAKGWALYVRLDKKVCTEAFATEKGYVEKPLSTFAEIRTKREKVRAEKVDEYKKLVERAKDDSEKRMLKQGLEKMGLREDGQTLARFETFPGDTKKITLVVDNVKQEVEVTHHIVRENEGEPVFDVWVAPKVKAPADMFAFYEELGTFSPAVMKEVRKLEGFPVDIKAVLDDGNNKKTLRSSIKEIRQEDVAAAEYDVPAGFKPVEHAPEAKNPNVAPVKVVCAFCQKECAPGTGDASYFTDPWSGKRYPACSEDHRREIIKKLAAEQRKK